MASVLSQIVEICIFKKLDNNPFYLLLQRSSKEILYPNLWQIVTGTMEENETAKLAAIREIKEETDLKIKKLWIVPYIDSFFDLNNNTIQLAIVFAAEAYEESEIIISSEHQKYEWLKFEEAKNKLAWPGQKQILEVVNNYIINNELTSRLTEIKIQEIEGYK